MVLENQGNYEDRSAAIRAIAPKIGCSRESLRRWVARSEIDARGRNGVTSEERDRIKALEREVRELRQANEILKKASAYFAPLSSFASKRLPGSGTELDRPFKR